MKRRQPAPATVFHIKIPNDGEYKGADEIDEQILHGIQQTYVQIAAQPRGISFPPATTITSVMPRMAVILLPPVGSSMTVLMSWTMVSFWHVQQEKAVHDTLKKFPQNTDGHGEAKATMAMNTGERDRENRSLRLNRSTSEKPMAAQRKPLSVWSMVSQPWK